MKRLTLTLTLVVLGMSHTPVMGANSTWTGPAGTQEWSASANWTGGVVPGSTGGTTDGSTATFNQATAGTSVTVDPGRNLGFITFDTSAGAYTIGSAGANGGNSLLLTSGGAITVTSAFTGTGIAETFNAPLVLEGGSTTTSGSYSFTNNATSGSGDKLNFAGAISGGTSSTVTLNLNGTNAGSINNISGSISNGSSSAISLVLGGNGTWELSGNNSGMTGGTITVGGVSTLLIGSNTALGSETVTFNGTGATSFGAIGNITVSNSFLATTTSFTTNYVGSGNLTITGTYANTRISNPTFYNFGTGSLNFGGDFYLDASASNGGIFQMANFGSTEFSGNIYNSTSTGVGSVFLSLGSGTITLAGNYAATGNFWNYGGTLVVDTTTSTARLPNAQLALGGVTLDLSGAGGGNQTVSSGSFRLGQTTIQETNSSTARLNLGSISKNAGATVNFGVGAASTSTGNSSGILGAAYVYNGTDWAIGNGASTAISNYTAYTAYTGAATSSTSNYLLSGSGTIGSSMSQNTFKLTSATGTAQALTIASGATDVTNGVLYTGSDAYAITGGGSLTATSALYIQQWGTGALTINATIADNGTPTSLTKAGTGVLALSGTNTYTGATYVVSGTLSVSSDASLGGLNTVSVVTSSTASKTVTLSAAAPTNLLEGSSFMGSTVQTVSGSTVTLNSNANQAISSGTTIGFIAPLALDGSTLQASSSFSMSETLGGQTVNRSIELGANGGTLDVASGQTLTVAGIIGNAVNQDFFPGVYWTPLGALSKTGLGTLMLSGTNSYSGGTNINGGILEFATTVSMPSTGTVTVNNGATLAIAAGGAGQFGNGSSGAGTIGGIFGGVGGQSGSTVTLNSGSSVGIDTTAGSVTYAGNITNAGVGLTKLGTNSLTLSGSNTYTGPTLVSSGTLVVANTSGSATGTGALTVNSGATLAGNGIINSTHNAINGNVTVGNGGTDTISFLTMTATGTTTITNATLAFNLDSTSTNSNKLAVGASNAVVFGSGDTLTLNITGASVVANSTLYELFTSTVTGTAGIGNSIFGGSGISYNSSTGVISGLALNISSSQAAGYYSGSYLTLVADGSGYDIDLNVQAVPEPSTYAMLLGGLALLVVFQRSRRMSSQANSSRNSGREHSSQ